MVAVQVDDSRLDCAILRPMESDGDHFLAYYLTENDKAAVQFKNSRSNLPVNAASEEEVGFDIVLRPQLLIASQTAFHFVRDYEVVKVEQEIPNEFLLVIDEGDVEDVKLENGANEFTHRAAGVYYKSIERKMLLKKKRVNVSRIADSQPHRL